MNAGTSLAREAAFRFQRHGRHDAPNRPCGAEISLYLIVTERTAGVIKGIFLIRNTPAFLPFQWQ
jgi:hypothetical protein